ncbi:GH92 family glycosyl hydrolase [Luteibacter sp. UNC138MFCol5.1]|uniref:GH92 family glycosyl hydrolase n=1 Tax=Luteibacter sp. UNC138MFCol5.1 TaxID=1502774 RepID=UPI0021012B86|nr:GH92 family glycosyl hydrolase [Luteibacter sp. UNC138MFCol5.1]
MFRPIALAAALVPAVAAASSGPADLVNPLIGTTNGGNVFPGAVMPFGMLQFSPEASPLPGKKAPIAAPGGYEYRADAIRGFSLTNVEGWGCAGASGDVPLMPVTEDIVASPSTDFRHAYASKFSHANETAKAGHYRVALDNGVTADLTAALHSGAARFAFPAGKPANVLVRASDSEVGSERASVTVDAASRRVSGQVTSGNFCGYINEADRRSYYTLYFVAEFDQPFASTGAWQDTTVTKGGTHAEGGTGYGPKGFPEAGKGSGAWVGFAKGTGAVNVRVGISYVSAANAQANLDAEIPKGTTFESLRDKAVAAWNERLSRIDIEGGTPDQRTVFYTALYHSLMHPNVFSDVNGEYRGFDDKVHRVAGMQRAQYANFSGWDVYRSQLPLVAWLEPDTASDIAQSLFNQAQQNNGVWDRWTHNNGGTHVMNGDPAAPSIAGIHAFGARGFDAKGALASLVHAADNPTALDTSHDGCEVECVGQRPGLDAWLKLHYIPVGAPAWGPAADTLETVAAEFGISALAQRLGDDATSKRFLDRAQYWRNLFDPQATPEGGYIRNRNADGSWALVKDDDDKEAHAFTPATGDGFVEGSAAQYVWMVPFNVGGLFDAMGGREKARKRLDAFFYQPDGSFAVTKSGPLHAELDNEPSIGTPWLYNYAGQPWKTQELVRRVLDTIWLNAPNGIPGNDDLGEMSSWYVFASLGVYPAIPGRAELVVGSPLFKRATIHRANGDVVIDAPNAGAGKPYVVALKVNGKPSARSWLPEDFALKGGRLEFDLSTKPNKAWASKASDAPPSFDVR